MRAVVQRVSSASVSVAGDVIAAIGKGLLVLVAFQAEDATADLTYLAEKIVNLRIFEDEADKMNLSLQDVAGELLIVSQFTLYGDVRRGRRPSFTASAPAAIAERLYEEFLQLCRNLGVAVASGQFQAHMEVALVNDGPVTLLIDSK